jgi:hypothetical protein
MNRPGLKGGASCKRCIIYEVRSVRKLLCFIASFISFEAVSKKNIVPYRPKAIPSAPAAAT